MLPFVLGSLRLPAVFSFFAREFESHRSHRIGQDILCISVPVVEQRRAQISQARSLFHETERSPDVRQ